VISFDSSLLVAYYNAKAGVTASGDGSSATGASGSALDPTNSPTGVATAPRAPWAVNSPMPQEDALVSQVLLGHRFINPSAVTSDVTGASADYNKLFSLYQGLNALEGLATKAQDTHTSTNQLAEIKRRFSAGLTEVQSYIQDTKYDHVSLTQGTLTQELKSSVGVPKTNATYTGPAIASGSAAASVKAFEGDVKFSVAVKKVGTATPFNIDYDLSEMGSTPRTMSNVVNYLNTKLKADGLNTKFAVSRTPAQPTTTTVNGKTVTTSAGQDSYSLQIKGASYEALTFSAPKTADSVYVVQSTGDPNKKVTTTAKPTTDGTDTTSSTTTTPKPTVTSQLIKFQTDTSGGTTITDPNAAPSDPISKVGNTYWVDGEAQQVKLPDTVAEVQDNGSLPKTISNALQTIAGPDGSVYVLANVDGATSGQDIKGNQDVALMKYDSAGKLVFTRTLGAANSASGLTMAVSADGKVAIAGSVTGALDVSNTTTQIYKDSTGKVLGTATTTVNQSVNGANPSVSDSFVSVFDASGVEQWTQRRGGTGADEATAVAFGADGSVYVGGRTQSTMPGASGSIGGWDGYVSGYSATGKFEFTNQIGTTGTDAVSGIVVDGSNVYTSSIENGDAVVRSFNVTSAPVTTTTTDPKTGQPVTTTTTKFTAAQTAQRDLGGMGGGSISGMSLYNGKIYLGGSSGSDKLLSTTGTTTKGYSGGYDAFALEVDANLSSTGSDKVAYYGGAGIEKGAEVQFSNGKAWIAGQTTGDIAGTTKIAAKDAYLARLNIDTGTVEYQTRYSGADGTVQPGGIAVSQNSSSVLDKLGLPMGTIQYTDSNLVVSGTSVRAGDQFYMVDPDTNVRKTITIDGNETLDTLAKKITRASGYKLSVSVTSKLGTPPTSQLDIKPANSTSKMEFVAGPAGRDALSSLGIDAGIVSSSANTAMDAKSADYLKSQKQMGLNFDNSLNLNSPASIKDAIDSLQKTMKNVQLAYNYLKYGDPQASDSKSKGTNAGGPPPAYLTNQIANLNAGLQRLLGSA
jgi:hypothetical protein